MKKLIALLPLILASWPPATFANVATRNPKFCTTTNAQGVMCRVSVRIMCVMDNFVNSEGNPVSCVNPDQDNETPFVKVQRKASSSSGYCGKKNVTIKYKVCNRNESPIRIDKKTWIKYNSDERSWEDDKMWIGVNQCKVYTIIDKWDPCEMANDGRKASKYMEAQISARILGDPDDWSNQKDNAYCYCHLFKAARAEFDTEIPIDRCDTPERFRITEIVHGKYIELYNPSCAKKTIVNELYLVKIPDGSSQIALNDKKDFFRDAYSLRLATGGADSLLPEDGFLMACSSPSSSSYRGKAINCDSGSDDRQYFPLNNGKDTYLLVQIENGKIDNYRIIDIYGSTLGYSQRIPQDLTDNGRAQRHTDISAGTSQIWQPTEWYIRSNALSLMDPREWQNAPDDPIDFVITEITNPMSKEGNPPKYVEIYTDSGKQKRIDQPIQLVIFHESNGVDDIVGPATIDLQGLLVPSDGFMLFCNSAAAERYEARACDYEYKNKLSPVKSNGDDNIALIRGDLRDKHEVLDIFGIIGVDGTGRDHNFVNSRVVRDVGSRFQNNGMWDADEWCIIPYDLERSIDVNDPADPREWTTRCNTPEPTHLPSSSPTHVPSIVPTHSVMPSQSPTKIPTVFPTMFPSFNPSDVPTNVPSISHLPSISPTDVPTTSPTTSPSSKPSSAPSTRPTISLVPSSNPTSTPTVLPTQSPSTSPTSSPTIGPSMSQSPSYSPTSSPTSTPTDSPTSPPTKAPSYRPTISPKPSASPSARPVVDRPLTKPSPPPTPAPIVPSSPTHSPHPTSSDGKAKSKGKAKSSKGKAGKSKAGKSKAYNGYGKSKAYDGFGKSKAYDGYGKSKAYDGYGKAGPSRARTRTLRRSRTV